MVLSLVSIDYPATFITQLRANKKPLNHGNDLTADKCITDYLLLYQTFIDGARVISLSSSSLKGRLPFASPNLLSCLMGFHQKGAFRYKKPLLRTVAWKNNISEIISQEGS